jgi:rSAM/selenodomain-associated transferase 2
MTAPLVSVVIPVLNEAGRLRHLITALSEAPERPEIIVVDGGSTDQSASVANAMGARVMAAARGRGPQMAAGAACAHGEVLLFLHADTRIPPGALTAMCSALAHHPAAQGGNFRLLFDGSRRFDRWLEDFYDWIRVRGLYYGDSGIFLRRRCYRRLGGYRPLPIMEDYDLVRRMEAAGPTVCVRHPPLVTSSRRFRGRHPIAIFLGWLGIHALFHLGFRPARLARLYDNDRRRQRRV